MRYLDRNPACTMFPSFVPDKARPLAARPFLIPSIFVTCLAGSVLPPGWLNTLSTTAITLYLSSQIPKATTGKSPRDYMLPIQAALFFIHWMDFYVLHSPSEFSRTKDQGKTPKTWWERLSWAWDLNTTYRGIGWNWKVKNVREPVPLSTTKWGFVRTEIAKAFAWYLLFDLCWYSLSISNYKAVPAPEVFSDSIPHQVILALATGIMNYCSLSLQFSLFAALTVAIGMYTPQGWPPLMGRLRDVTTVRDFWGKFWHQNLRRKLTLPFNILNKYIPIQRGTLLSKYLQLYLAFIATTFIHHLGAMNLSTSSNANNLNQVAFFMLQPVAITAEDFVVYLGKRAGLKESRLTRAIGSVWTFAWFTYSLRFAAAFFLNSTIMAETVLPSIIHGTVVLIKKYSGSPGLREL